MGEGFSSIQQRTRQEGAGKGSVWPVNEKQEDLEHKNIPEKQTSWAEDRTKDLLVEEGGFDDSRDVEERVSHAEKDSLELRRRRHSWRLGVEMTEQMDGEVKRRSAEKPLQCFYVLSIYVWNNVM